MECSLRLFTNQSLVLARKFIVKEHIPPFHLPQLKSDEEKHSESSNEHSPFQMQRPHLM